MSATEDVVSLSETIDDSSSTRTEDHSELEYRTVKTVEVCPQGRLVLHVQDHDNELVVPIRVSSGCLKAASPVWRKMLDKNNPLSTFYKNEQTGEKSPAGSSSVKSPLKSLVLEDDNASILLIILWQIHHRFDKVPSNLSVKRLFELAILCDKYDCAMAMHHTVKSWVSCLHISDIPEDLEAGWIVIAETFGFETHVLDISKKLRDEIEVSNNANAAPHYSRGGTAVDVEYLPQRFLDVIIQSREERIQWVITRLQETDNFLSNPGIEQKDADEFLINNSDQALETRSFRTECFTTFEKCLALAHGLLTRRFKSIELYEFVVRKKGVNDWSKSLSSLLEKAGSLRIEHDHCLRSETTVTVSGTVWRCPLYAFSDFKVVPAPPVDCSGAILAVPYISKAHAAAKEDIPDVLEPWE